MNEHHCLSHTGLTQSALLNALSPPFWFGLHIFDWPKLLKDYLFYSLAFTQGNKTFHSYLLMTVAFIGGTLVALS